ncbi:hypothetical protein [Tropicibacter alexandrii]|uniref:hypothetical protein n=1 Tax=Tropicibacter alexandrii TaxID=2267683 RepID=UPI000EF44E6E|nr:hypothetical protein [Tropicibacter alexandrii]
MFGVSRFKGKVILIAGAEHPVGASLSERLARFGARVVAVGWSDVALLDLAARSPSRIETLALSQGRRDVLELLRDAWGEEPLHGYIDLMPILESDRNLSARNAFDQSAGLARAMTLGLRAGHARAVMAIPQASGQAPEAEPHGAGHVALMQRIAEDIRPARLVGLSLPGPGFDWTEKACVSAGDTILTLSHDVSRGIRAGTVVDWDNGRS